MPAGKKLVVLMVAFLGLGAVGVLIWRWRSDSGTPSDPRLTYPTSLRNVRPHVAYVGDEQCAGCHKDHAATYSHHPMGQSMAAVDEVHAIERFDEKANNPLAGLDFHYQIMRRGTKVVHQESRRGENGNVLYRQDEEVQFSLGSGRRGRSYLINRDGSLFQSPISWYTQGKKWDISPGYRSNNRHFERPVHVDCLFCHANRVEAVKGALNRYEQPIFKGLRIGCERCHGPGELHVRHHKNGDVDGEGQDIVNPGLLAPALRDAVCEQCHLQGEGRVLLRGRELHEYRPGLPLHLFVAVFARTAEFSNNFRAVGQVEQMTASQCYQKSGGKLGCISCHDPHRLPAAGKEIAYYRKRCQACHQPAQNDCVAPDDERQKAQNNCLTCHMERFQTSDIAHTAVTDHRILRRRQTEIKKPPRFLRPDEVPLVHFHRQLLRPEEDVERELGIALVRLAYQQHRAEPIPLGLERLEKSLQKWPGDQPALDAKGLGLTLLGRNKDALETLESLLERNPEHEEALGWAATLAGQLGQLDKSVSYWQRTIAINPYFSEYHYALGVVHFRKDQWKEALVQAREALRLNASRLDARKLLILSLARLGDRKKALEEFEVFKGFRPPDVDVVKTLLDGR
jgi:tetratricopeptide (TPR) repeat protein